MDSSRQGDYRFDGFRLDPVRRLLFGSDGQPIPLKPKVFDVLLYLVERPAELVPKQSLLEAVWPHVIVEENNLNKAISTLRHVLGETRDEHRFIVTEPGRGYRFVASVETAAETTPSSDSGAARTQLGTLAALAGEHAQAPEPYRDPVRKRRARPLIYWLAGMALLAVALIAVNDRLRQPPTPDEASASASPASQRPFTFRLDAPAGSAFGLAPAAPLPALSPDGTRLAFAAPLESKLVALEEKPAVWVQTLGDPKALPLLGTEHDPNEAGLPFWSPDGRYIAFAADGRLKRVEVDGSTEPRELAVIENGYFGGTWSTGGTILIGTVRSGLYQVPADGGEPTPFTEIDAARGETSHRFPVILPDGRRFLYLILSSTQPEHAGLYLGSLDEPRARGRRLLPYDSNAALWHDPAGRLHLLFVRDSVLLAQPFDAVRGELIGEARRIAESIDVAASLRYAAFTASIGALAYRPHFAPRNNLTWIDAGGIRGSIVGTESVWHFPALAPDGTKLSVARQDQSGLAGLWMFDFDRDGIGAPLGTGTEAGGFGNQSAWTPDSRAVVFTSIQTSGWVINKWTLNGVAAEPLLEGNVPGSIPGGKRVRDVTEDVVLFGDQDFQLWAKRPGEQLPRRLIGGRIPHARVSPDGRWLAFTLTDASGTDVWITAFPELGDRWRVSRGGGYDPQWRSDGQELYYIAADRTLMKVKVEGGNALRFGTPEPLFRASFDRFSLLFGSAYAAHPDGKRFMVVETTGDENPHLVVQLDWSARR